MLIDGRTIVILRQSKAWVYLQDLFQLITNKGLHAFGYLALVDIMPDIVEQIVTQTCSKTEKNVIFSAANK